MNWLSLTHRAKRRKSGSDKLHPNSDHKVSSWHNPKLPLDTLTSWHSHTPGSTVSIMHGQREYRALVLCRVKCGDTELVTGWQRQASELAALWRLSTGSDSPTGSYTLPYYCLEYCVEYVMTLVFSSTWQCVIRRTLLKAIPSSVSWCGQNSDSQKCQLWCHISRNVIISHFIESISPPNSQHISWMCSWPSFFLKCTTWWSNPNKTGDSCS